jgi:hypothetical protein
VAGPLGLAAPPIQRWQVIRDMLKGPGAGQVAAVDADTMVRWDAPDFFELLEADALGAVHAGTQAWLQASLDAYGRYFPGLNLEWTKCFNSGLVVLNPSHASMLDELVQFYSDHRAELELLQSERNVGCDQTLLNYFAARSGTPIHLLDPAFNRMRCFELPLPLILRHEKGQGSPAPGEIEEYLASAPGFDFIDQAYIWHFTSTVRTRAAVMRETWRRVQRHYPEPPDSRPARACSAAAKRGAAG